MKMFSPSQLKLEPSSSSLSQSCSFDDLADSKIKLSHQTNKWNKQNTINCKQQCSSKTALTKCSNKPLRLCISATSRLAHHTDPCSYTTASITGLPRMNEYQFHPILVDIHNKPNHSPTVHFLHNKQKCPKPLLIRVSVSKVAFHNKQLTKLRAKTEHTNKINCLFKPEFIKIMSKVRVKNNK